jgi:hypothetical protein
VKGPRKRPRILKNSQYISLKNLKPHRHQDQKTGKRRLAAEPVTKQTEQHGEEDKDRAHSEELILDILRKLPNPEHPSHPAPLKRQKAVRKHSKITTLQVKTENY